MNYDQMMSIVQRDAYHRQIIENHRSFLDEHGSRRHERTNNSLEIWEEVDLRDQEIQKELNRIVRVEKQKKLQQYQFLSAMKKESIRLKNKDLIYEISVNSWMRKKPLLARVISRLLPKKTGGSNKTYQIGQEAMDVFEDKVKRKKEEVLLIDLS